MRNLKLSVFGINAKWWHRNKDLKQIVKYTMIFFQNTHGLRKLIKNFFVTVEISHAIYFVHVASFRRKMKKQTHLESLRPLILMPDNTNVSVIKNINFQEAIVNFMAYS